MTDNISSITAKQIKNNSCVLTCCRVYHHVFFLILLICTNNLCLYLSKTHERRQQSHALITWLYLYELLVCLINLVKNAWCVFHKVSDCIHVVERDEEDVLRAGAEKHLVLKCHGHQVIELGTGTASMTSLTHPLKLKEGCGCIINSGGSQKQYNPLK